VTGAYMHQQRKISFNNLKEELKEELKEIHRLFLNPKIIISGDFNDSIHSMNRLAHTLNLN
jgi:hypothetical protein